MNISALHVTLLHIPQQEDTPETQWEVPFNHERLANGSSIRSRSVRVAGKITVLRKLSMYVADVSPDFQISADNCYDIDSGLSW